MNYYKSIFYEYDLRIKYIIIHYISLNITKEIEVTNQEFASFIDYLILHPNIHYSFKLRYYAKNSILNDSEYVEISKELYQQIYIWQNKEKNHELYIQRKYMSPEIDIDLLESSYNLENEVIHKNNEMKIEKILKKELTKEQYSIFVMWFYKGLSQTAIARAKGISKQAVSKTLMNIKRKIKKILNNRLTFNEFFT